MITKKRVSDIIKYEDINKWRKDDIITLTAGTGVGKSYFIKNVLYNYAKERNKKILFLIHRSNCKNQFEQELIRDRKTDVIDIRTYQSLECIVMKNSFFDYNSYDYIVSDEFHYFWQDSWNKQTDISLNSILNAKGVIKIFMSATGDYVKRYLNNIKEIKTIDYELPITYDFIKSLTFFNLDDTYEMFINECISSNEKAIFFIQSAQKAYELYKKHEDVCIFNCSKSNKTYYKYVDEDIIDNILINERFDKNILITTTCMEAGVNIIDNNLKHIVCELEDVDMIKQCIGRKRLQSDEDFIYVYVKTIDNNFLGGKETQIKNKIKMADFLREHTVKEYIEKFPKQSDYNQIVYDDIVVDEDKCTKKINELMYYKCKLDICNIQLMKSYEKYGYNKFVANKLGFWNDEEGFTYRIIEEEIIKNDLESFLENNMNKRLYKEDQKELIEKIGLKDKRGRIQKSVSILNEYMIDNYEICITSKRVKEEGKLKTVWILTSIEK